MKLTVNKVFLTFLNIFLISNICVAQIGQNCTIGSGTGGMYGYGYAFPGKYDCTNTCVMDWSQMYGGTSIQGDGTCHDGSVGWGDYNCSQFNYDGGDCINGCTNSNYTQYNPNANVDNGTCTTLKVYGCTDSNFTQYNSNANINDGTCTTEKVYGCTESGSAEYHNQGFVANTDDGSCQTTAVFGCKSNGLACNYNVPTNIDLVSLDVTVDNGTCINAPGLIDNLTVRYDNLYEEAGKIGAIILEWDDVYTENNISKFIIEKKLNDGSWGPVKELENYRTCPDCPKSYTVGDSPKQAFYDFDKENCNTYSYRIYTIACESIEQQGLSNEVSVNVNVSINNTWDFINKKLITTKGDYKNRVELSWTNNNNVAISNFEILRKEVASNQYSINDWIKIGETSNEVHHFVDYNIAPNVIYDYRINAVIPSCSNDPNSTEDVYSDNFSNISAGFRSPFSSIHGQITYDGFGAVENAEVFAIPQNEIINKSLKIDQSTFDSNDFMFKVSTDENFINNDFSFMFWIKPDKDLEMTLLSGFNLPSHNLILTSDRNLKISDIVTDAELLDSWNQISGTYNNDQQLFSLFLNGENVASISSDFSFGSFVQFFSDYSGLVDEISLWNNYLSDSFIAQNYDKFHKRQQDGLIAYYHCDEGVGNGIYDSSVNSQTSIFNYNHINIFPHFNNFADDSPSSDALNYSVFTDSNGYYGIEEIRFGEIGSNFKIIPAKYATEFEPAHTFSPSNLSAYIADDIDYISNYNFTDISSFRLTGNVYFLDPKETIESKCDDYNDNDFDITGDQLLKNCNKDILREHDNSIINSLGVKGVKILVDGQTVIDQHGNEEVTNNEGFFDIQVPIGLHEISVEMDGHNFVSNIWDTPNHISIQNSDDPNDYSESRVYNFIKNEQNIQFYDYTRRKLVGRVCGGITEAEKPYDGTSINNIGVANFTLKDALSTNPLHSVNIVTDESTGEFSTFLLPLDYNVMTNGGLKISVIGNIESTAFFNGSYPYLPIDMSQPGDTIYEYDNSINFVYRSQPVIDTYTDTFSDSIKIIGETEWNILNQVWDENDEKWIDAPDIVIPIITSTGEYQLGIPVLKKDNEYNFITSVEEVYFNYKDSDTTIYLDPVTKGRILISDGVNSNSYSMDSVFTDVIYTPNEVNTSLNGNDSFKKQFTMTYSYGAATSTDPKIVDFYAFGSRVDEGLNFFSTGPEVVEMVLRDPPGDQSYSYIESGSSYKNEVEVYSVGDVVSDHLQKDINLGTKLQFSIPFGGPIISTEIIANTQVDLTFESIIDTTETITFESDDSQSYRTSSNQFNISSGGDLYIANNYNIVYGTNKFLEVVDKSVCGNQGVICLGESSESPSDLGNSEGSITLYQSQVGVDYTIGTSTGLEIVPVGFQSKTVYDQNHIVNTLIPTLKWVRNTYFGIPQVYSFTEDSCYNNQSHPEYDKLSNPNPCYIYNKNADLTDPYVLPFNVYDDINIADYIPEDFVFLVQNALENIYEDGQFSEFSQQTIDDMEYLVELSQNGSGVLDAVNQVVSSSFWSDFASILGGQNLLLGVETFKSEVIDFYANELSNFQDGMTSLISVLDNMTHSVPDDKVEFINQQISLWEEAIRMNEQDKASIFENTSSSSGFSSELLSSSSFGPDQNYSFSAGNNIEESYRIVNTESILNTINYSIDGEIAYEIGGKVQGFGGSYQDIIPITFGVEKRTTNSNSEYLGFGYVLNDDDESDYISVDVKQSNVGWGPIFRKRAGQTMCPHEEDEEFLYFEHNGENGQIFAPATQPREVPGISVEPAIISGVPEAEAAVFNLQLTNNSAAMQDMVYTLMVDEASNPHGAILMMDGQPIQREIMVPYNQTINKTLLVYKGPEILDYTNLSNNGGEDNSIGIILRSSCQYSYGTSNVPDIADTVKIGISYTAGCTDLSLIQPGESWVMNKNTEDDTTSSNTINNLTINLNNFNHNYYSLENVTFEYKKSLEPDLAYNPIITEDGTPAIYVKDLDNSSDFNILPQGSIVFNWNMQGYEDGDYDIRAYSNCGGPIVYSDVHSGHKDTRIPEVYGTPQPADGILSPNDEIILNWSETIDENRFYSQETNISMKAVKNESEISHDAYLFLDSLSTVKIPYGLNLKKKSFTVEMWINPISSGILFEQGYNNNRLKMGILENGKLFADYYISGETISVVSQSSIPLSSQNENNWHHVAFVFDNDQKQMSFVINGELNNSNDLKEFLMDYVGEGEVFIGNEGYSGGVHELRIWSTNKQTFNLYENMSLRLIGNEQGLQGYWPMDELSGLPKDLSRLRHINGDINWAVSNKGFGYNFENNSILKSTLPNPNFEQTDNFTLEFWFKTEDINNCILSTGSIDNETLIGNYDAWSVGVNNNGNLYISHNFNLGSDTLLVTPYQYNDNQWHHFALVKNSKANTTMFIDANEISSCSSGLTRGFFLSNIVIGAKQYFNGIDYQFDNYFSGSIDEVRLWSVNRNLSQIERFKNIRLNSSELGLEVYYPFEKFETIVGNTQLVQTLKNEISDNQLVVFSDLNNETFESNDLPIIRMNSPYLSVFHSALAVNNQILLNITENLSSVEGTVVDVSIDNIYDKYGNKGNPATWSFYVDKNQLVWSENKINIESVLGSSNTIETSIINQGGSVENFSINNIPNWLSVNPSYGIIEPNSSINVELEIDQMLFIGDYSEKLLLTGSNNVSEELILDINVEAMQPEISVVSENYQYDMSFTGKISVDGIRSRDDLDLLIAYVDNEPRGYSRPTYIDEYDAYFVFLTVYSNSQFGDQIEFRLWDASEGKIQSNVSVNSSDSYSFYEGSIVGNLSNLTDFDADNTLNQEIYLAEGWNWLSLNLTLNDNNYSLNEIPISTVTHHINSNNVEIFKGQNSFTQYSDNYGWLGSLNANIIGDMYMIKINQEDTISYEGYPVDVSNSDFHINIEEGWNWIGYLGQRPLGINEALSSLSPAPGDLIKNKSSFSLFASESIGWVGTLNYLTEGEGYMFNSSNDQLLVYPENSLYGSAYRNNNSDKITPYWEFNENKFEYSMNIIAEINDDKIFEDKENSLGAFNLNECLGAVTATELNSNKNMFFLTVNGLPSESINFKYYDHSSGTIYQSTNSVSFVENSILGSYENPYLIEFIYNDDENNFNVFPNPFESSFNISFDVSEGQNYSISIYDLTGRHIKTVLNEYRDIGNYDIDISASDLAKGLYIIQLDGEVSSSKKHIIKL